jgi:hypothetical protein
MIEFGGTILIQLLPYAASALLAGLAYVGRLVVKKYNIDAKLAAVNLDTKFYDVLDTAAYRAVKFVEEYFAKKIKDGLTAPTGGDKLAKALSLMPKSISGKVVKPHQADRAIHAMLAGLEGTGATGPSVHNARAGANITNITNN